MNLREAAMLALTAIEQGEPFQYMDDVVAPALRLALANIQSGIEADKPYAWMAVGGSIWRHKTSEDDVPLYTHPPGSCV